jgi:hypothetical protein
MHVELGKIFQQQCDLEKSADTIAHLRVFLYGGAWNA